MPKQKINVVLTINNPEKANELVAKAWADIVINRINQLPEEQRMPTYDAIMDQLNSDSCQSA